MRFALAQISSIPAAPAAAAFSASRESKEESGGTLDGSGAGVPEADG